MYEQIASNKRRAVLYAIVFFFLWVGIGAILGWITVAISASRQPGYSPNYGGGIAAGATVLAVLALLAIAYAVPAGTHLVLAVSGARPADPVQYRQLHNLVEELAIGDGVPKPDVYVIDDPSPNAFATGISPNKAAITATSGLLDI